MARLIEAVVHNLHNADELLHQSYRYENFPYLEIF
jgi:hypothetical protein